MSPETGSPAGASRGRAASPEMSLPRTPATSYSKDPETSLPRNLGMSSWGCCETGRGGNPPSGGGGYGRIGCRGLRVRDLRGQPRRTACYDFVSRARRAHRKEQSRWPFRVGAGAGQTSARMQAHGRFDSAAVRDGAGPTRWKEGCFSCFGPWSVTK